MEGVEAGEYPQGTRTLTVNVSLPETEIGPDFLYRTRVQTDGSWVALDEVVNMSRAPASHQSFEKMVYVPYV